MLAGHARMLLLLLLVPLQLLPRRQQLVCRDAELLVEDVLHLLQPGWKAEADMQPGGKAAAGRPGLARVPTCHRGQAAQVIATTR